MGKVGSTSVTTALQSLSPNYSVYGVHTLQPNRVEQALSDYRTSYSVRRLVPGHLLASRLLLEDLARGQPRGRWKVITIVRDPIARNVSSFFQDLEVRHPSFEFARRFQQQSTAELVSDLIELFISGHDHAKPLEWFERELGSTLDIDVYDRPFPTQAGFQTYRSGRADLLLLRFEDLKHAWAPGISTIVENAPPSLPMTNVASEKQYSELYRLFKSRLRLPPSFIDGMYDSRFARHFYSSAELEELRRRWASDVSRRLGDPR